MIKDRDRAGRLSKAKGISCVFCAFCGHLLKPSSALAASFIFVASITAIAGAQPLPSADPIHVASWNIESLDRGSAQKVDLMAQHLSLLRLDVLALNHIEGDESRRNRFLDAIFDKANEEAGNDWQYRLFANRTVSERTGLVGVAWNAATVDLVDEVFRPAVDEGELWQRPPHAAKFSAGPGLTDVVVMPVQLETAVSRSDCVSGRRSEEASDLVRHISAARTFFSDDDLIVLGDTDCFKLDPARRDTFETNRSIDLESTDLEAFLSGAEPYTRVMLPLDQPEFRHGSGYSILEAETKPSDRAVSDHFVMLAPIRVGRDDD